MPEMRAAVVSSFDEPPHYGHVREPEPAAGQSVVDVLAAGLHPRVRTGARGGHYTSSGTLPMVPGVDAVGRRSDGTCVYFVAVDDVIGTMADRAVVDDRRAVVLPEGADPGRVAAAMNPAMSSWIALRRRAPLRPGQHVLVLGATGNAGTAAVQIARRLGAGRVTGAGRDRARMDVLLGLGADEVVQLGDDAEATGRALAVAAADADVVLDYLWGEPAQRAMAALLTARADRARALDWVQIGAVAGPELILPSVLLRSANLRVLGNGQGAVSPAVYVAELPALVAEIDAGTVAITPDVVPLADVEVAWERPDVPGHRTVFVP